MRKIIFHIGNHKTGSSTLQKFLYKNKKILNNNKILYPNECIRYGDYAHHNLAFELANFNQYNRKFGNYKKFLKIVRENKKKDILISSENFEKLKFNHKFSKFIHKIKRMNYNFIVIFFFRERISLYQTMIAELVKSGYIFKNSDHFKNIRMIKKNGYFEYDNHKFWFSKKKEVIEILKYFPVSKKNIVCINYKKNKTVNLFLNQILNNKKKINFYKSNLIFPKNINLRNGYYKIHQINSLNKIKKIIFEINFGNFIFSFFQLILTISKFSYFKVRSAIFEDYKKQILPNKYISKLQSLRL